MSSHCAIADFLKLGNNLVVSLHTHRYGGGTIAMVVDADNVSKFVDSFEDLNGECEWELWGLRDTWYPAVEGNSPEDALNKLRDKLSELRGNWYEVFFGIENLSIACKHPVVLREKCLVTTMEQLQSGRHMWNNGDDDVVAFFNTKE